METASALEWRGDHLFVTDPNVAKKLRRSRLSPSAMKGLRSCPSRWATEALLPRVEDPFSPAEIGSGAHKVFELLYQLPKAQRTKDRAHAILLSVANDKWGEESSVDKMRWTAQVIEKMDGLWSVEDPRTVEVVATEIPFGRGKDTPDKVDVSGVPILGVIDRVDKDADGNVFIVDYKTGKATTAAAIKRFGKDDEGDQLRLYALAYEAKFGVKPSGARLIYTAHGKQRKVPLTRNELKRTGEEFAAVYKEMNSYADASEYPTRASALCSWCPLVAGCPTARLAGKTSAARAPEPLPSDFIRYADSDPVDVSTRCEYDPLDDLIAGTNDIERPIDEVTDQEGVGPTDEGVHTMSINFTKREGKPYEGNGFDTNGNLDPNSYAAIGAFGISALALEHLSENGQRITQTTVHALAMTFGTIVMEAQEKLTGSRDLSRGMNTRLRGALNASLKTAPFPFGAGRAELDTWVDNMVRRLMSVANTALIVAEDNYPDTPWDVFAHDNNQAAA